MRRSGSPSKDASRRVGSLFGWSSRPSHGAVGVLPLSGHSGHTLPGRQDSRWPLGVVLLLLLLLAGSLYYVIAGQAVVGTELGDAAVVASSSSAGSPAIPLPAKRTTGDRLRSTTALPSASVATADAASSIRARTQGLATAIQASAARIASSAADLSTAARTAGDRAAAAAAAWRQSVSQQASLLQTGDASASASSPSSSASADGAGGDGYGPLSSALSSVSSGVKNVATMFSELMNKGQQQDQPQDGAAGGVASSRSPAGVAASDSVATAAALAAASAAAADREKARQLQAVAASSGIPSPQPTHRIMFASPSSDGSSASDSATATSSETSPAFSAPAQAIPPGLHRVEIVQDLPQLAIAEAERPSLVNYVGMPDVRPGEENADPGRLNEGPGGGEDSQGQVIPLLQDRPTFFFPNANVTNLALVWDFGGCGCTGFMIEGVSIVLGLVKTQAVGKLAVVASQNCFCQGLPPHVLSFLEGLRTQPYHLWDIDVFVSHKQPDRYPSWPYRGIINIPFRPRIVVGRSMTEVHRIPSHWAEGVNFKADEVWVPSHHSLEAFVAGGAERETAHIISSGTAFFGAGKAASISARSSAVSRMSMAAAFSFNRATWLLFGTAKLCLFLVAQASITCATVASWRWAMGCSLANAVTSPCASGQ